MKLFGSSSKSLVRGEGYNNKIIIACAKILFLKCVAIKIAVFKEIVSERLSVRITRTQIT